MLNQTSLSGYDQEIEFQEIEIIAKLIRGSKPAFCKIDQEIEKKYKIK
jgi:hypothetical protein